MIVSRSSQVSLRMILVLLTDRRRLDATNVLVSNLDCTGSQYVFVTKVGRRG